VNTPVGRRHQPMELTPQSTLLFRPNASMFHDNPPYSEIQKRPAPPARFSLSTFYASSCYH
jgi:hypothetical protein